MIKLGELMPERLKDRGTCPVGKVPFFTKVEAQDAAKRANTSQRTPMKAFRCSYGDHYHIGHKRGKIT